MMTLTIYENNQTRWKPLILPDTVNKTIQVPPRRIITNGRRGSWVKHYCNFPLYLSRSINNLYLHHMSCDDDDGNGSIRISYLTLSHPQVAARRRDAIKTSNFSLQIAAGRQPTKECSMADNVTTTTAISYYTRGARTFNYGLPV